jgi:hypothetical protein
MKRFLPLLAVCITVLVPLAGAQGPVPPPDDAVRARLFQRNHDLIRTLVKGGLRLASAEDALQRAECCSGVAEHLATEIQQAFLNHEKGRVAELGLHLRALLESGVAANLSTARKQIPVGSTLEKTLREVRDRTTHLVGPLEEQLLSETDALDEQGMRHTLKALQVGRTEVEKALQVPTPARERAQP